VPPRPVLFGFGLVNWCGRRRGKEAIKSLLLRFNKGERGRTLMKVHRGGGGGEEKGSYLVHRRILQRALLPFREKRASPPIEIAYNQRRQDYLQLLVRVWNLQRGKSLFRPFL